MFCANTSPRYQVSVYRTIGISFVFTSLVKPSKHGGHTKILTGDVNRVDTAVK